MLAGGGALSVLGVTLDQDGFEEKKCCGNRFCWKRAGRTEISVRGSGHLNPPILFGKKGCKTFGTDNGVQSDEDVVRCVFVR